MADISFASQPFLGQVGWDNSLETYYVEFEINDMAQVKPKIFYGKHKAEFVCVDSVCSFLNANNLKVSTKDHDKLLALRDEISYRFGDYRIQGSNSSNISKLELVCPSGLKLAIAHPILHTSYFFSWGNTSSATFSTAKLIGQIIWPGLCYKQIDIFSQRFTHEFLTDINRNSFSISINKICDWFMADIELSSHPL